jgi:hypothetical protein
MKAPPHRRFSSGVLWLFHVKRPRSSRPSGTPDPVRSSPSWKKLAKRAEGGPVPCALERRPAPVGESAADQEGRHAIELGPPLVASPDRFT